MRTMFVVVGVAGLPEQLRESGFELLTTDTDPVPVAAAVRSLPKDHKLVIVARHPEGDPRLTAWIDMVKKTRGTLVLGGPGPIAGCRHVDLPATVADLLAGVGARTSGADSDAAVVNPDFTVTAHRLEPEEGDPFEDLFDGLVYDPDPEPEPEPEPDPEPAPAFGDLEVVDSAEDVDDESEVVPSTPDIPTGSGSTRYEPQPEPDADDAADEVAPSTPTFGAGAGTPLESAMGQMPTPVVTTAPVPLRPVPEPEPQPASYAPPGYASGADSDALLDRSDVPHRSEAMDHQLAPVIVVMSVKGGVGKSAISMMMAQRASQHLRKVVLVDGSRGQGDQMKRLRIDGTIPSIYDAAVGRNPRGAIVSPKMLAAARPSKLPRLNFGAIFAPRTGQSDSAVVTNRTYAQAVMEARKTAELVIVDTQIMEDTDNSGLWDQVWLPMISRAPAGEVWMVAVTSGDIQASIDRMAEQLPRLQDPVVGKLQTSQTMVLFSLIDDKSRLNVVNARKKLAQFGRIVGVINQRTEIYDDIQLGKIPHDHPELARPLDEILFQVTGMEQFDPDRDGAYADESGGGGGGLFGLFGLFKRRKAS